MRDFLGQEYDVGDEVLYAAMSGRSATMILGEVVDIFEAPASKWADSGKITKVKVQPLMSSRWKQHYGRRKYIDTRTGKSVDPFRDGSEHYEGWNGQENQPFASHIEVVDEVRPVTITVTENVVKWSV